MSEAQPVGTTWRLFFALWPGATVRRQLEAAVAGLPDWRGRRVAPQNLHITLAFLGTVDAGGRTCSEAVAASVKAPRFELTLDTLGYWRRQGVVWIGAQRTPAPLLQLVDALRDGLRTCPVVRDPRPYQVHLTVMRKVRRPPPSVALSPIVWRVENFALVSSRTLAEGSEYTVLREWSLH